MTWNDGRTARERFIERVDKGMSLRISRAQKELAKRLAKTFESMDTEDGKIKPTYANSSRATAEANRAFDLFTQIIRAGVMTWALVQIVKLLELNRQYFETFDEYEDRDGPSVHERATKKVVRFIGYDTEKGVIRPGTWLDALGQTDHLKAQILRKLSQAILSGTDLKTFRRQFLSEITSGLGIGGRYYDRVTHDLFMQVDQMAQIEYARGLGLEFILYAGTIKNNSRSFCRARAGRVYTLAEVNGWNSLTWQGKIPGTDVKVARGGYRCRHQINFISEIVANDIANRRGGLNTYA